MPAPVRDRCLDEGDQELGRRPCVARLHYHARILCRRRRDIEHFRRAIDGTPWTPERPGGDQRERRAVDADRDLKILIVIARFVERRSAAVMMYLSIRVLPSRFSLRMVRRPRPV